MTLIKPRLFRLSKSGVQIDYPGYPEQGSLHRPPPAKASRRKRPRRSAQMRTGALIWHIICISAEYRGIYIPEVETNLAFHDAVTVFIQVSM
jgi:hypothetical protein